jgi:hypothetical protein
LRRFTNTIPPLRRALASLPVAAALALAACTTEATPPSTACFKGEQLTQALRAVPGAVRLQDGTRLSRCVELSTNDDQLQSLGAALTGVADGLADDAEAGDAAASARLGYVLGAAERGAGKTQGVQLELVRRLESAARRADAAGGQVAAALRAGRAAGVETG